MLGWPESPGRICAGCSDQILAFCNTEQGDDVDFSTFCFCLLHELSELHSERLTLYSQEKGKYYQSLKFKSPHESKDEMKDAVKEKIDLPMLLKY